MLNKEVYVNRRKKLKENFRDGLILIMGNNFSPLDCEDNTYPFIKQCKNTRYSSTRRVLVMRHVLVGYELHEDFSKHIGKLVCRHGAKPCNKETELLGTLKASITTT